MPIATVRTWRKKTRRGAFLALGAALASLLSGCAASAAAGPGAARPIVLRAVAVASLDPVPADCRGHGQTSEGTYPQIVGSKYAKADKKLAEVFKTLVVYSPTYREHLCFSVTGTPYGQVEGPEPFIAASSSVISFMAYELSNYWDGVTNTTLVSCTELLPSAQAVSLDSLFADPETGVRVLAVRVREATAIQGIPLGTVASYMSVVRTTGQFALTTTGMVLGFTPLLGNGNEAVIVVGYSVLRPYLGSFGRHLVSELAGPVWAVASPTQH